MPLGSGGRYYGCAGCGKQRDDVGCCPIAPRPRLEASAISRGALFRKVDQRGRVGSKRLYDRSVARIVKHRVAAAALDPGAFAGHSLPSGFATSAIRAGVAEDRAMPQTCHRSVEGLQGLT